jgi:hypothetical protein
LMKKWAKQPCLIAFMWLGFLRWSFSPWPHSYPHSIIFIQSNQKAQEQLTLKLAKMTNGKVFRFWNHTKYVWGDSLSLDF